MEKSREKPLGHSGMTYIKSLIYIYIYVCVCMCMYVYICMYMYVYTVEVTNRVKGLDLVDRAPEEQ